MRVLGPCCTILESLCQLGIHVHFTRFGKSTHNDAVTIGVAFSGDRVKRSAGSVLGSLDNLPRVLLDISELRHRVQDSIDVYVSLCYLPYL